MNADYTGTLETHKIPNVIIEADKLIDGSFALPMGAFFLDGLVVTDLLTNSPLPYPEAFKCQVLDVAATGHSAGKPVYTVIKIKNPSGGNYSVNGQYVLGKHVEQSDTIQRLLESGVGTDLAKIYYSQLLNRPESFDVDINHLHDASQITGKDQEVAALNSITEAITLMASNSRLGHDSDVLLYIKNLSDIVERLRNETGVDRAEVEDIRDAIKQDIWYGEFTEVGGESTFDIINHHGTVVEVHLNGLELYSEDYTYDENSLTLTLPVKTDEDVLTILVYGRNHTNYNVLEYTNAKGQRVFHAVYNDTDFVRVTINGFTLNSKDFDKVEGGIDILKPLALVDDIVKITVISTLIVDGGIY